MCYSKIDVELPAAIPFKKNVDNPTEPEKPYQEGTFFVWIMT